MNSISLSIAGASGYIVLSAAPSGARYIINALSTTSGVITARSYPSSGVYGAVPFDSSLSSVTLAPTGTMGYGESLEITATAACTVTMNYTLSTQFDQTNQFNYTSAAEAYSTQFASQQKWAFNPSILSGSYTKTIN